MPKPWLSVAMTTYNARDYLPAALDSVASQDDGRVEVIAVDDGSTDETPEILDRYRSRLDLKVIAREHSGNWIASMNLGLRAASGEYVCFLHHDDHWLDGRLNAARHVLERRPDIDLLLQPSWFIDRRGDRLGVWRCGLGGADLDPDSLTERLLVQNFVAVPAPVFRRAAALAVGGLDEGLWYSADWDFWLKLAAAGRTYYLDRPYTAYRIHPVAATWRETNQAAEIRRQLGVVLERHAAGRGDRRGVRRVARFSADLNARLSSYAHGQRPGPELTALVARFVALGPAGWHRYVRDSRIIERAFFRVRAGMLTWRNHD